MCLVSAGDGEFPATHGTVSSGRGLSGTGAPL